MSGVKWIAAMVFAAAAILVPAAQDGAGGTVHLAALILREQRATSRKGREVRAFASRRIAVVVALCAVAAVLVVGGSDGVAAIGLPGQGKPFL